MKKSINIIGAGRAAQPIAAILQHHPYYYMQAVFSRSLNSATDLAARIGAQAVADIACLPKADITLIGTPDAAIVETTLLLARLPWIGGDTLFVHLSGSKTIGELEALAQREAKVGSLHPVFAFADVAQSIRTLSGSLCALEPDENSLPDLEALAGALGLRPFVIASAQKARYHASLSAAANFSVALADFAQKLLASTQIPIAMQRELVASLMQQNAGNLMEQAPIDALTGPIVRGDAATVAMHLAATSADEQAVYRAWAMETLHLARPRLSEEAYQAVYVELNSITTQDEF